MINKEIDKMSFHRVSWVLGGFWVVTMLMGCDGAVPNVNKDLPEEKPEAALVEAQVFIFQEWEKGIDAYQTRVIVTSDFLRMDDGIDAGGFLLFDRKSKNLSSLSHDDQTVLRMKRKPVKVEKPEGMLFSARENDASDMPSMGGKEPVHTTLLTNGEACYDVVSVPGMQPDAVEAMREYLLTLAGEQAQNIYKTPEEFRAPCLMSNLIHYPVGHLEFGFPLREWDYKGYGRALVEVSTQSVSADLFVLDAGYHVYQLSVSGLPAKVQ